MYRTVNGIRMAYSERGRGQAAALLLIHGFPLDSSLWDGQLRGLSTVAHVIAPDLRGSGNSDVPPGPYSMEMHAADLVALLDHLGIERAIVGGLSMGGYVALAFWRLFAERVQALVLLNTRAAPDSDRGRQDRDASAAKVQQVGVEPFVRDMMPRLLAESSLAQTRLAGRALAMMAVQPAAGLVAHLQAMRDRPDSQPLLPTIRVPVLVVAGQADAITPAAEMSTLAGAIPVAQFVTVPRAAHLSPLENPRAVNTALRQFIQRL